MSLWIELELECGPLKKLYVKLDSPALKNELTFARDQLITKLNKAARNNIIENIVIM